MGLTRIAITRPLAILMFILGLVMMGVVSYRMLHVDRMPNISFPFVSVSVSYPGASPEDVETLVAKPIEAALGGLSGVTDINSNCSQGRANINLQLAEGADANQVAIDVGRKLASIANRLPADATTPVVNKADPNAFPIMEVSLSGQRPIADLYDIANTAVQPQIANVLGVADASITGGLVREVHIDVDYTKLEAYGLTLQQIINALARENVNLPAGSVNEGPRNISIRSIGYFQSIDELKDLVVSTAPAGTSTTSTATGGSTSGAAGTGGTAAATAGSSPIFLHDVADVTQGYKTQTRVLRFNGQDSVGFRIIKQSDANSLQVADDVRKTVAKIQRTLPPDVKIVITNDTSYFTRAALDAVQNDLSMAIFLTAIVLLLFLHTWRNTLIVILAIPTSLLSTFLVMYALGFSLDTISMMALALTVGILVDDSIVVLENIHRHLRLGEMPRLAALKGRSEIGLAAMAITFTDVVVYLPVAFMQGNIGQLFREYGLTIATATLFSLFVSFTLTPMLASRWLKAAEENEGTGIWDRFTRGWERNYDRVAFGYGRLLSWALRHRPAVVAVGFIVLALSISLVQFNVVGTEYAPQEDDGQLSVNIQFPPGTSLQGVDTATKQLEAGMSKIPEIESMFTSVGSGGGGFGGGGAGGSIDVQLVDKSHRSRSIWEVINDVRRIASGIPEVNVQASVASPLARGGGGGSIQVRLAGDNLDTLASISNQVEQTMRGVPGILDVRNGSLVGQPEVRALLDRKRMAEMGVNANTVGTTLRTAVSGNVASVLRPEGQDQQDITVRTKNADSLSTSDIAQIPLTSVNGAQVRVGQIANLAKMSSPAQIVRTNGQRVVTISGIASGRPMGDVARDVSAALNANVPLPDGYSITLVGSVQQMNTAFNAILSALTMSVLLIYMLMVALYESWLYPLAIMFSLPVSLVGAFGGLLLTGNTFNIFSLIGMIMLMGLVAKNAILLVDYTNNLRARGKSRTEAIVEAGRTRLRPILMTTSTVLFAMLPLAMKFEAGAESRAPMAVVIMGGVISSTLLTLVLVPVMYTYLDGLQARLGLKSAAMKLSIESEMAPAVGSNAMDGEAI